MEPIGISVVVATLNRSEWAERTVRELLEQGYAPLQVVLVDQSPEFDARLSALADAHPELIDYHHTNCPGLPRARNFGWRVARYDAILYLDDDVHCFPGLISEHVRTLLMPNVGVVGGGVEDVKDRGVPDQPGRLSRFTGIPKGLFSATGIMEVRHVKGCNFSVWRRILERCEGFDERLSIGAALYEELDFCLRAAQRTRSRIVFNGGARVIHFAAKGGGCRVKEFEQYMFGMAHNRMLIVRCHLHPAFHAVAFFRLLVTAISQSLRQSNWRILGAAFRGARQGFVLGG